MKKAPALSTIFISAALPALAQVPPAGACFVRDYDAAHLAANPGQGVAGLTLWFYDSLPGDPETRTVALEARLADQGQARAAGAGGQTLRSDLGCRDEPGVGPSCWVDCDGGGFSLAARPDGGLEIATDHAAIGDHEGCGRSVNLAEGPNRRTVYRLAAAPAQACAGLARVHPLPEPGCFGTRPAADPELARLRIWLRAPEPDEPTYAFPWIQGIMAFDLAALPTPAGPAAGPVTVWFYCSSIDGLCRAHGDLLGTLRLASDAQGLTLASNGAVLVLDPEGSEAEITALLARNARLARLPAKDCMGMDE